MESSEKKLILGRLGKVFGLNGWLRIHSFTEPQSNIANYRTFLVKNSEGLSTLELDQVRQQGTALIGHFRGIDQPEQAQELVGAQLQVAHEELPELQPGEYYWHQLEGLTVRNCQGQNFGKVARLLETGANDVLVVNASEQSIDEIERLIPYLPGSVVKDIDLEQGVIEVDWDADYLQ